MQAAARTPAQSRPQVHLGQSAGPVQPAGESGTSRWGEHDLEPNMLENMLGSPSLGQRLGRECLHRERGPPLLLLQRGRTGRCPVDKRHGGPKAGGRPPPLELAGVPVVKGPLQT